MACGYIFNWRPGDPYAVLCNHGVWEEPGSGELVDITPWPPRPERLPPEVHPPVCDAGGCLYFL